jgi:hypothetical protein
VDSRIIQILLGHSSIRLPRTPPPGLVRFNERLERRAVRAACG